MSRKKRRFEQLEAGGCQPAKDKAAILRPVPGVCREEDRGRREGVLEGQGDEILMIRPGGGALAVLVIALGIFYVLEPAGRKVTAQTALGKAIETSQAVVSASPQPAGSTVKSFKTERRAGRSSYSGISGSCRKVSAAVSARRQNYFAATSRLSVDRAAATTGNSSSGRIQRRSLEARQVCACGERPTTARLTRPSLCTRNWPCLPIRRRRKTR